MAIFDRAGRPGSIARRVGAAVLAVAGLLAVGACDAVVDKSGKSGDGAAAEACNEQAPLFDQLPAYVVEDKGCVLKVTSSGTYPPMNYFAKDGKTIIGFQPDLKKALEKQLGIRIEYVIANFDAVLGGIESGRYDSAMMTMTDSAERRKKVHFVDYGQSGSSIVVRKGNAKGIGDMADLCGLKVSTVTGYVQVDQLQAQSKKCVAAGKQKIEILRFPQQVNADQAVSTRRADAQLGDTVTSSYSVRKSGGSLELLDTLIEPAPFGMPFRQDRTELAKAFQQAFTAILENGEYEKAAQKYGLQAVVPGKITVNDGHGF